MEVDALQSHFSLLFFSFSISLVVVAVLVELLRTRPWWCNCAVCKAYVTSSWSAEFDNLCDWYAHLLRESPTRTITVHVLGCTVTANPDNVEHMLKTRFENYPKGKPFSSILGDLLGHGIFNVDGEHWRFQRKMASAELGSAAVRVFASQIVAEEVGFRLLPLLDMACKNDAVLDLQDVFRQLAFDSICKISFGLDPGCLQLSLPMSDFGAAFDKATRLLAGRATHTIPAIWKVKRLFNRGSEGQIREAIELVDLLVKEVIHQRRKYGFASDQDLLSRFMRCIDNDSLLRHSRRGRGHRWERPSARELRPTEGVALLACGLVREHAAVPAGAVRLQVLPRRRRASGRHIREEGNADDVPRLRHGADGGVVGERLRRVPTGAVDQARPVCAGEPVQVSGVPGRPSRVPRQGDGADGDEERGRVGHPRFRRRRARREPTAEVRARPHGHPQWRARRQSTPENGQCRPTRHKLTTTCVNGQKCTAKKNLCCNSTRKIVQNFH
ncbi:cytochrome P450 94C1 isoform X2 [Musa acuminata AAA Group]|uniref:cytochrome P450 94C1 isoform X2 n=1 Tax=Musa acuminata AAA Group TaxID=214697 RepID=UPI0031D4885E